MNEDAKAMGTEGIVATPAQQKVALKKNVKLTKEQEESVNEILKLAGLE